MKTPLPLVVIAACWMAGGVSFAEVKPPVVKRAPVDNAIWTPWLNDDNGSQDYHRYWSTMREIRCYPRYVEGRMFKGREEYRAIYRPYPAEPVRWMTYHGMDEKFFKEQDRPLTKLGYKRLCYQAFTTAGGVTRIQATWLKTREALQRDPRYLDSDGKIRKLDWKKYLTAGR